MTYFILLLAAVGIINNPLINYMQKRRSIAMYKSVGLSNRQNVKITLIEGFYVGLIVRGPCRFCFYMEIQTIFLCSRAQNRNDAETERRDIARRRRNGNPCNFNRLCCSDL
ncbi:MAG: FtsX-like permease family protein [Enterocloster bolteae]